MYFESLRYLLKSGWTVSLFSKEAEGAGGVHSLQQGRLLGLIWYFLFEILCMQDESLNYARLIALQDLLDTLLLFFP